MEFSHLSQQLSLSLIFMLGLAGWVCLRMSGVSFEVTALVVTPLVAFGWWQ